MRTPSLAVPTCYRGNFGQTVKTAVGRDGSLLGRRRRIIERAGCPATAGAGGVTATRLG
jgi:hypothetical protein